ncbi:MAG: MMPL family transporter [Gammaproteobacteria bacterium]|nr:MMPL family transporter [Gammaproteobacteria bacterium]
MKHFEAQFGQWVLKYRWLIMLMSLVLVFLAASGGQHLRFTGDYRVFFSDDNPQLLAFDELEKTYTKSDNILFALTPKSGDVFTQETLSAVESLTEKAWQTPFSIRVDSLTNFQHTWSEEDDLTVENLVSDSRALDAKKLEEIKDVALKEPILVNNVVSPDSRVTGVNVTIQLPGLNEMTEAPTAVAFARKIADEIRAEYPNIEIRLTGMLMMNNAFSEESMNDMQSLIPLSFLVMLVSLGLLIKGFTGTFATLAVIALSIAAAMGLGGYLGYPISPPSSSAPIIILTIAIANSVHVLVSMIQEMRRGSNKRNAIVESLRLNIQPVTLASVTTAIGFLTMNFSDVPPFQHLGTFVALGVLVSLVLSLTFLPALMSILPMRVKAVPEDKNDSMEKFGKFVVNNHRNIFWGMLALVVVTVSLIPKNELNDIFVNYFDESIEFRTDTDYITDNLAGTYLISYSLESGEKGGIGNPDFLKEVEAFTQWYKQQPETLHVATITDIMKRLNKNMHSDEEQWYILPDNRELSAQYLLLYEMSLPYGLDLNNQINIDKSATKFTVTLKTLSSKEMIALEARANTWLANNTSNIVSANASGPSLMFAHIGQRNIVSMLKGTTIALILISILLMIALKSFKIGFISMVPNLVPAAMGFGLWGLFVGEVGLALSIVMSMTLGIVVDDTVHLLSKYQRARREKGYDARNAVIYAFTTVGRALVTTTIVLILGFLVLAMSAFELNSAMGMLTALVIALALFADFLLLPAILIKFEDKQNEKNSTRTSAVNPTSI